MYKITLLTIFSELIVFIFLFQLSTDPYYIEHLYIVILYTIMIILFLSNPNQISCTLFTICIWNNLLSFIHHHYMINIMLIIFDLLIITFFTNIVYQMVMLISIIITLSFMQLYATTSVIIISYILFYYLKRLTYNFKHIDNYTNGLTQIITDNSNLYETISQNFNAKYHLNSVNLDKILDDLEFYMTYYPTRTQKYSKIIYTINEIYIYFQNFNKIIFNTKITNQYIICKTEVCSLIQEACFNYSLKKFIKYNIQIKHASFIYTNKKYFIKLLDTIMTQLVNQKVFEFIYIDKQKRILLHINKDIIIDQYIKSLAELSNIKIKYQDNTLDIEFLKHTPQLETHYLNQQRQIDKYIYHFFDYAIYEINKTEYNFIIKNIPFYHPILSLYYDY